MRNLDNPRHLAYHELDGSAAANEFTIVAGVAGWIETDVSGSGVPAKASAVYIIATPSAAVSVGARVTGGTGAVWGTSNKLPLVCKHDSQRKIDFYRHAGGNINYNIAGYWSE